MPRIALCCDVGPHIAATHLMRCLALGEELVSRGVSVVFVCDAASVDWAQAQIQARGLEAVPPVHTADDHVALFDRLGVGAVVFDSPLLATEVYTAVRRTGLPTLAIVDGDLAGASADVLVAPNVGAEEDLPGGPADTTVLAGLGYALLRNDVLANRPIAVPQHHDEDVPRVAAVFADADAVEAAPAVARLLTATGRPFEATFFVSDASARAGVAAVRAAPRQRVDAVEPSRRLHEEVVRSDVVIAVAAPSTYEWLCLGCAVGLVWAADRHVEAYRRLMVRRVVVGLGSASDPDEEPGFAIDKASRLLSDARERGRLAEVAWGLVDGLGRARVADALLALL